ncbi:MAG: fatty acid desaturase [Deltaproteobacteria bacterium]|nr:fatty acid desaturase [Deltaproteobacteria bacterium]
MEPKEVIENLQPGRKWPEWYQELTSFRHSNSGKAIFQLLNTLLPYGLLWYLMVRSVQLGYPYALTLLLALVAGSFLVRIFILFHDCVHGSLFKRQGLNTVFGYILGVLVFTPFEDWRYAHLRHHATYANLDARGFGDIWTMTLKEYENSAKTKRLQYRLYRNPIIMLGLGAVFTFIFANRLPTREVKRKQRLSVLYTNLLIIAAILLANWLFGWRTYLLIQLPAFWFAGAAGIWLFYVQHQFPGGYWARKGDWEPLRAAMEGSSFYQLPPVLRWLSSNIGYHHVHHLSPRIPNYHLKDCYDAVPALQAKAPLTILRSVSCVRLKLWDEARQQMVAFPADQ